MDEDMMKLVGGGVAGGLFLLIFIAKMIFIVNPNEAHVLVYWGRVSRTVTDPGFNIAFPIGLSRRIVSTKLTTFTTAVTTVVEKNRSPIQVSAVCVYRVADAAKALIDVQGYQYYVATQASTVLKSICSKYPYESANPNEPCLKKESDEIIQALTRQLQAQVSAGGIQIMLVRLNDLTYAPEIAQSMLLRQQAQALVDARRTVVEGAVTTVKDGLDRLAKAGVRLSPESSKRLASSLTLLLCAGERGEQHSTVVTRTRHS
jgi:regulator of protease activity HflC (stomatin/prohibitin superfamily)